MKYECRSGTRQGCWFLVLLGAMDGMRRLIFFLLAFWGVAGVRGAEVGMTAEQILGAERVGSLTVPTPGELFAALGKVSRPDWKKFLRTGMPEATASREQIALSLGTLVADGYLAVEAQDGQSVKNIGKEIIGQAKKLNVSQGILARGNSLNDFAEHNDWSALREELEATQNEVKIDMKSQKDDPLTTLVTVGAWIRSLEIVSALVAESPTPEAVRLLQQPVLLEYLGGQLALLPDPVREAPVVAEIRRGLETCQEEMTPETLSPEDLAALQQTLEGMVRTILHKTGKP